MTRSTASFALRMTALPAYNTHACKRAMHCCTTAQPRVMKPAPDASTKSGDSDASSQSGPEIRWLHSFVTDEKICSIYFGPMAAVTRQHDSDNRPPAGNRVAAVRDLLHTGTEAHRSA